MTINHLGYSERGMVNALCEDLSIHGDLAELTEFLSWCQFPNTRREAQPDFTGIQEATLIVEQSFADFGDLDLLILLNQGRQKQSVLIEAKVATDTASPRSIDDHWLGFLKYLEGDKRRRSNLFVQIFRKMRLIKRLHDTDVPAHAIWGIPSLGANRVVRRAANRLSEYRENPWYVVCVPYPDELVSSFFSGTLARYDPEPDILPEWSVERVGYLTWPTIHTKCLEQSRAGNWRRTLARFDWNEHQVYPIGAARQSPIGKGVVCEWEQELPP
jgi:hypothetical protein